MDIRKFVKNTILTKLKENHHQKKIAAYHGTRSFLPFQSFETKMIGSGLVSSGNRSYDGFFFTTEKENAEFYTEWFICKVEIQNVEKSPLKKVPTEVLNVAYQNKKNYLIEDVLDGAVFSDIIVVPKNNLESVDIIEWQFVGDKEFLFEKWDETFGDDEGFTTSDMIDDTLELVNIDINFLLKIPVFSEYYQTKKKHYL